MTDLSIDYVGFKLPHPLVVGASPMVHDLDRVRRLVDAGAAAIVMHSLFEEQIDMEAASKQRYVDRYEDLSAEIRSILPMADELYVGPDEYLEHLRKVKEAAGSIPVFGSLNGTSNAGWLGLARGMVQAGADAIELNVYSLPTDPDRPGSDLEQTTIDMVRELRSQVSVPLAVKLSPFYTSPAHLAVRLEKAGANALVLFNRFYQPDIDMDNLDVAGTLELSTSSELRLRLRWIAILSARLTVNLAVTGGVHTAEDAIKSVMAGASAVQVVSAILAGGPEWISRTRDRMAGWLDRHEYPSLSRALATMNLARCPDPAAYERGNYMRILQGWARSHLGW